jgi:YD repeat-containing protein
MTKGRRTFRLIALLLVTLSSHAVRAADIQYVYDELGRLVAVIEPSGDTATYTYDAVGNLLSIDRHASSAVSVITFQPASGPIGTTVTIFGTGFSATPSQNTVTFNGTGGTVSTASATKLVINVPSGATTGTIGVTAPGGSASSGSAFTVTSATAPTITSFTPTVGAAGTSVTITGTNLQTTPTHNRVRFSLSRGAVSSSSATSIATAAPPATASGRITVDTPAGQAVSTDDFFIPPSPYTASSVAYTGRMGYSDNEGVAIGTASKIGLVVFDGTAGQRVSLMIDPGPISTVTIFKPDATTLATKNTGIATTIIEPVQLPITGTYAVNVDPTGSGTGTVTIAAYNVPSDATGTITAGGSSETMTITTPGQNGALTFSGTADDRVSLKINSGAVTGTVSILKPDGSTLDDDPSGAFAGFIDANVLPTTGTYSVFVNPSAANTGSATLTLYDVPDDVTGSITPGGSAQTVGITTPGQNGFLTFSGTSGQRVSLKTNSGAPNGSTSVLKPDGSTLHTTSFGTFEAFMEPKTLTATGTHTLKVDPLNFGTGNVTMTLYDVPADLSGSLTVNGSAVQASVSTPGQNGAYTFSGTASQTVTVRVTNNKIGGVTVKLLKPDGSQLTQAIQSASSFNLAQQILPTTGTYTVVVDPQTANTGSLDVAVTNP